MPLIGLFDTDDDRCPACRQAEKTRFIFSENIGPHYRCPNPDCPSNKGQYQGYSVDGERGFKEAFTTNTPTGLGTSVLDASLIQSQAVAASNTPPSNMPQSVVDLATKMTPDPTKVGPLATALGTKGTAADKAAANINAGIAASANANKSGAARPRATLTDLNNEVGDIAGAVGADPSAVKRAIGPTPSQDVTRANTGLGIAKAAFNKKTGSMP